MSLAYSWTLKMEATCSSDTLVEFQLTLRRDAQEDGNLLSHCYENLRSYTSVLIHHSLQSSSLNTFVSHKMENNIALKSQLID
jgi:hypothetical protein